MQVIEKVLGAFGYEKTSTLLESVKALQASAITNAFSSISNQIFPSWQVFKDFETYRVMEEVYSVVNRLATTAAMIPLYAYQDDEYLENHKLSTFLSKFTYAEKLELFTYLFLADEVFIYKERLEFGVNAGVQKFHYLHPNLVTLVLSSDFPTTLLGYIYRDPQKGIELSFQPEDIIFIKGFNPTQDYQSKWRGLSKISVLAKTLTRLKAGKDASVAQMQNGGVPGIVYQKKNDVNGYDSTETAGMRKENFARYLRNSENKGAPYMASVELGYLQLGLPLADLEVADLAAIDFKMICNAYAISDRLFNNDATGSEISDDNARKALYLTGIKPTLQLVQDSFNNSLVPDFRVNATVAFDLSDIMELQENMLEKMNALAASPVMVPNDVMQAAGYDRSNDPLMDLVYVKQGYQPITDFDQVEPV